MERFVIHAGAVAGALLAVGLVAGCERAGPVEPESGVTNVPAAAYDLARAEPSFHFTALTGPAPP